MLSGLAIFRTNGNTWGEGPQSTMETSTSIPLLILRDSFVTQISRAVSQSVAGVVAVIMPGNTAHYTKANAHKLKKK